MEYQQFGALQVACKTDPRKAAKELVDDVILIEPEMAARALAVYLIRTADAEAIAALAEDLTTEFAATLSIAYAAGRLAQVVKCSRICRAVCNSPHHPHGI